MSDTVAGRLAAPRPVSGSLLGAAAAFWFVVTVIGQWVFLYYIVAFYGPSALSGDFESWNRHPFIDNAFVDTTHAEVTAFHTLSAILSNIGFMAGLM